MEAEFIAVTEVSQDMKYISSILKFLVQSLKFNNIINLQKPLLFCDNYAAVQFTKFKAENVRNRYIDVKYKLCVSRIIIDGLISFLSVLKRI